MAFTGGFRLPEHYGDCSDFQQPTPTTENDQPYAGQRSIPENTPSFVDTHYRWDTNQVYRDPGVLESAHTTCMQVPLDLELWSLSVVQKIAEAFPSLFAYDPGQNVPHWDSQMEFYPHILWPTSGDRQPLSPLVQVDQESDTLHHLYDQSIIHPSHVFSSHTTHSHYPYSEPSIPHRSPSHQSFSPTSLDLSPHPTFHRFLETNPHPHLPSYRVPHQNFAGSSRRRRVARAVEYDGLWIDEEELLKGLTEPDGELTLHQCCWEENHSPCGLWIRGDKSYINAHIQKWHRGKPGGEKSPADCRWSACGKTMLKESIARHIVNVHLGEIWECQGCGKWIVRSDAYGRHVERSEFDVCRTSRALITYSTDARVIDPRAALQSGGELRYASA